MHETGLFFLSIIRLLLVLVSKRRRGCWRHEMLQRRIHAVLAPARIVPREVVEAEIIQDGVVLLLKEEVTLIC